MLDEGRFRDILQKLLAKTREAEVRWRPGEVYSSGNRTIGREFFVRLPQSMITIGYYAPPEGLDYVAFALCTPTGEVIERKRLEMGGQDWELAVELAKAAHDAAMPVDILSDIEKALDQEGIIGVEPGHEVLKFIAGLWQVDFDSRSPASEVASIDTEGNYFLEGNRNKLYFWLKDVAYDTVTRDLSFTKIKAKGERTGEAWDTEFLKLSEDCRKMKGISAKWGTSITYTRKE